MTTNEMRECITSLGHTETWKARVANMKPTQVYAIFYSNFEYDGTPKPKNPTTKKAKSDENKQISIWELPNAESWGVNNEKENYIAYL